MPAEPVPGLNGGMRASSVMEGKLRAIHAAWIRFAVFGFGNPRRNDVFRDFA